MERVAECTGQQTDSSDPRTGGREKPFENQIQRKEVIRPRNEGKVE